MSQRTIDPQRSATMRAVRSKNTEPEMVVRRFVCGLGFRYRLHRKDLPGVPDLVFPKLKRVIFVHGCFWHGHLCARGNRIPKTRRSYWKEKISRNIDRDARHIAELRKLGWKTLIVWECDLKARPESSERSISRFLHG